jgi:hypothetical protein
VTRNLQDIVFTLIVMALVGVAVWDAQRWELKARLFPWVIGIPLICLLAALLIVQLVRLSSEAQPGGSEGAGITLDAAARRRAVSIVGWLLGFLGAIWILGFPIGGTLATLAYLKLAAHEKWPISVAISGGTALLFLAMINFLATPFPRGTLFELVGI